MSKAIMILDEMPEICNNCLAFSDDPDGHDYYWCQQEDKALSWEWRDDFSSATFCPRPDWCPLKEMPRYREWQEQDEYPYPDPDEIYGWNKCLKAIEES